MEIDHDEQLPIKAERAAPGLDLGLGGTRDLFRVRSREAVVNTRSANIWIYDDDRRDVVPPFLVGEVAGSLSIDEDREQLRRFAETIFEWLERTERSGGATICRLP
jgi:hypothetical protein